MRGGPDMKFDASMLFCNMPKAKDGYVFDLPMFFYSNEGEAKADAKVDEETVTLEAAFGRIAHDIHHDA